MFEKMQNKPPKKDEKRISRRTLITTGLKAAGALALGANVACEKQEREVKLDKYVELVDEFEKLGLDDTQIFSDLHKMFGPEAFVRFRNNEGADLTFEEAEKRFKTTMTRRMIHKRKKYIDIARQQQRVSVVEESEVNKTKTSGRAMSEPLESMPIDTDSY